MDDVMLIYQSRRVMPEVVLIVLRPKGNAVVLGQAEVASESGRTRLWGRWPVVELWKLPADAMLALRDPGLVPWIPLMETSRPPQDLLKDCREIIDAQASPQELGNILAVSQILASLRYNDRWLFSFFGGKVAMIESPYLKEIIDEQVNLKVANQARHDIVRMLRFRFGAIPPDLAGCLEKVTDKPQLDLLADWAETCPDLAAFQQKLPK